MYYESHITIEPVFEQRLEELNTYAKAYGFKVANLLMQKRKEDSPERSKSDTFCTGWSTDDKKDLEKRMVGLITALKQTDYKIYRYKIEECILDSREADVLGLLDDQ